MLSILLMAGGAWVASMSGELGDLKKEQQVDRKAVGEIDKKVGVIEERTQRTQEDVKDLKEGQKDQGKKLDELLRRTR